MPQPAKYTLKPIQNLTISIGDNIARIRKAKGVTQEELAEEIGITQTLVSKYESGRLQVSADMIASFALALHTSADNILGLNKIEDDKVSLRISKRMQKIELLPESDQRALLKTIDVYLRNTD